MSKTIELIISPTGETKLQTKGFAGASCKDASRALQSALGLVTSDSKTAEFHASTEARQDVSNR